MPRASYGVGRAADRVHPSPMTERARQVWPLGLDEVDSAYRRGFRVERHGPALPLNVRREA